MSAVTNGEMCTIQKNGEMCISEVDGTLSKQKHDKGHVFPILTPNSTMQKKTRHIKMPVHA
jgi:hypothetical protein